MFYRFTLTLISVLFLFIAELNAVETKPYPFLWFNNHPSDNPINTNTYAFFRMTFQCREQADKAIIKLTAGNRYKLYINNHYLGRGPVRESMPWYQYDEYNFTRHVIKGKNVIAVHVYHRGLQTFMERVGVMGLWVDGKIKAGEQTIDIKTSADTWKILQDNSFVQNTPEWSESIKGPASTTGWGPGPQEYKNMRQDIPDWTSVEYDDSGWSIPNVSEYRLKLYKRPIPLLREVRFNPVDVMRVGEISAPHGTTVHVSDRAHSDCSFAVQFKDYPILDTKAVHFIEPHLVLNRDDQVCRIQIPPQTAAYLQLDFGKQVTGFPRISWKKGVDGVIVDLAYSEDFLQTERPNTWFERTYTAGQMTLKDGPQSYEAAFLVHAFRYMGLVIRNLENETIELQLDAVDLNFMTYPVQRRGSFWCDDPFYNQLYETSEWTNRLCMHDLYEDCPRREQVQWLAEANVQSMINYYLYGDPFLVRQLLLMGTHPPEGVLQSFIPSSDLWDPGISTYPMHYGLALWNYYLYTGDIETVKHVLPKLENITHRLLEDVDKKGLFTPGTDRQVFDIPPEGSIWRDHAKYGSHLHTNCHFLMMLNGLIQMEKDLGFTNRARDYQSIADKLENAIRTHFWNNEKGLFNNATGGDQNYISQGFSGDVVWSQVALPDQVNNMWLNLFKNGAEPNSGIMSAGYIGSFYMMRGLYASPRKHHWHINAYLRKYYLDMLQTGATTCWEHFLYHKGAPKLSFVHGASGHFPFFAGGHILGVTPLEPGFETFQIYPKTLHLAHARGDIPTSRGPIRIEWICTAQSQFKIKITVPKGCTGKLFFPEQIPDENARKAAFLMCPDFQPERILVEKLDNHYIFNKTGYKLLSGDYHITVKLSQE